MSTKLIGMLALVALSMNPILAQDWRSNDDNDQLIRLTPINQDGRLIVTNTSKDIGEFFGDFGRDFGRSFRKTGRNFGRSFRNIRRDTRSSTNSRNWMLDRNYPRRGTRNFVNVYLGLNNFLEDGSLPNSDALYNIHPITSWYAGLNLDNITRIYGPLYLDWGVGLSMQDFSFENTRVQLVKDVNANSITFTEVADITGNKSKINVSYLNLHFVPSISFGRYSDFRLGFGVYGGYKIGSFTKYKYDDANGDKQKEKQNDNLFINPFKYGFRALVGWNSFDLFFNYDITELFEEDKAAPRLNPITFGIIF